MPKQVIRYGDQIPDETELRLGVDLEAGKRAIELGVSKYRNSIAFAQLGAKAIAVDPRPDAIAGLRAEAANDEVSVQCHESDLGDLGFATSGSVELVVAVDYLDEVSDLGRVLRQVNRVLRSSRPIVISVTHPFQRLKPLIEQSAAEQGQLAPPTPPRSIAEWFTALNRSNFRVDQMLELGRDKLGLPTNLLIRARKEGD